MIVRALGLFLGRTISEKSKVTVYKGKFFLEEFLVINVNGVTD